MNAEIIGIGSELLLGQIANTDAQYISQQLSSIGIDVYYHTVVGDNKKRILEALDAATSRANIIITTGGLGPTMDDLSKEVVAEYLKMELVLHNPSLDRIKNYFHAINRPMSENNAKQAMFPKEAIILQNNKGTAPGAIIEKDDRMYVILPGPPFELQPMFHDYVIPYLAKRSGYGIYSRVVRIYGIGESKVEEMLKDMLLAQTNPTIAPLVNNSEVTLRITAKAATRQDAEMLIAPVQGEIKKRLGNAMYGYDDDSLETVVVNILKNKGYTLSVAESCSGGHICDLITNVAGASEVLIEGCITYSNEAKIARLNVLPETIARYGAVSHQTVKEMANGIRNTAKTDIGIAVTGIAGPSGGSADKPVGLVYMAIADHYNTKVKEFHLTGDRIRIKNVTALRMLDWLRLYLIDQSN